MSKLGDSERNTFIAERKALDNKVAELEETNKELARVLNTSAPHKRITELERKIREHDQMCDNACQLRKCGFKKYNKQCPDCPKDWKIEEGEG